MKLIEQSWNWYIKPKNVVGILSHAARNCYQSFDKTSPESDEKLIRHIISNGHHSVLEHLSAGVKIITQRGVTHELVRHRIGIAISQESTRFTRYDGNMEFIKPVWIDKIKWADDVFTHENLPHCSPNDPFHVFIASCIRAEMDYKNLLDLGWRPEQAREILPNSLKTSIFVTANLREWRHIFNLRCSKKAHPQIRTLFLNILDGFKKEIPVIFEDINL